MNPNNKATMHDFLWTTGRFHSAALLVLLALLAGCRTAPSARPAGVPAAPLPTVLPGPAPTRALSTLDGESVTLATWRGKAVVLNFWATWCFPCRAEMPLLATVHGAHPESLVVVAVNLEESEATARRFAEEFVLPFPILLDAKGELADDLGVKGLPTTILIDAEGNVVGSHLGGLTEETLTALVEQLTVP